MLSIIVCSRDSDLLKQVSANVAATVGTKYEIIAIDNKEGKYGICEAYNIGASRSRYPCLCFMHEDILFHTQNWGGLVSAHLADAATGLIGVAGGVLKLKTPSPWFVHSPLYSRINILQRRQGNTPHRDYNNPHNDSVSEVVTVDGVWFCCRREVWEQNKFDSQTFKEFHFYDLDFSMQVFKRGLRVRVVYDILLEHLSTGSYNKSWVKNAVRFSDKWSKELPASSIGELPENQWRKFEYECCKQFIQIMLSIHLKNKTFVKYLTRYILSDSRGLTSKKIIKEAVRIKLPGLYNFLKKQANPAPERVNS